MRLKVLITVPDLNLIGGKANYYSALEGRFKENVEYFTYGPRSNSNETGKFQKAKRLINDYLKFRTKLKEENFNLVHVNPSLEPNGFLRDSVFVLISLLLNVKVLVFWRGWSTAFEKEVSGRLNWLFKLTYKKADAMIVLADDFRQKLVAWNFDNQIFQETTVLDESLIEGFSVETINEKFSEKETKLLFLARLEANKGVFEILETFVQLTNEYPGLTLSFGGTGSASVEMQRKISEIGNSKIKLLGFVQGNDKKRILQESHIFLFPSTHDEGLPNSVLEAMGAGMPVFTTWNAGIKDFFQDGEMGRVLENASSAHLTEKLKKLLDNRGLQTKMAISNHQYAKEHFVASKVVIRLEKIYRQVVV